MDSKILRDLCESYSSIYEPEEELTEEQVWEEVENWVNSLLEEGYDLNDYTWEEMFEAYIEEIYGTNLGGKVKTGLQPAKGEVVRLPAVRGAITGGDVTLNRGYASTLGGQKGEVTYRKKDNVVTRSFRRTGLSDIRGSDKPGSNKPKLTPTAVPADTSNAARTNTPPTRTSTGSSSKVTPTKPTAAPKPSTGPAVGKLGSTSFERRTPTSAELKAAQKARAKGASAEDALKAAQKTNLPTTGPTPAVPNSGDVNKSIQNFKPRDMNKNPLKPTTQTNSFEWGSTSKLVDDIANLYQSVYEAKKVDQDKDGDNDFADVRIARLIASGVSKEEAIRRVKDKSYNEEAELDEATRMRKELGTEGETATRRELARRSKAYQRSGSVDRTIAAAERGADRTTPRKRDESEGDYKTRMQKRSQTLNKLAANRKGSVRSGEGLRGYAAKVTGSDKDLQSARGAARSAGTLTPAEKRRLGEDFELWVNELVEEGYDLSDYTWDEMAEIYEETEEERKRNDRRARVAELQAQGRVMTSSKRASQKAAQKRQEKKEEMADKVLRSIQSSGSTRSSSAPMGSTAPEPKEAAPKANRKLGSSMKKDTLASKADELLRMLQNEDYQLWVEELLDEGYELERWTDEELVELYVEIIEEKYGTAAGRKKVVKMARAGEDIGKKGPGFENMVKKLTPKYGKERATKIAAAQMFKTHA